MDVWSVIKLLEMVFFIEPYIQTKMENIFDTIKSSEKSTPRAQLDQLHYSHIHPSLHIMNCTVDFNLFPTLMPHCLIYCFKPMLPAVVISQPKQGVFSSLKRH